MVCSALHFRLFAEFFDQGSTWIYHTLRIGSLPWYFVCPFFRQHAVAPFYGTAHDSNVCTLTPVVCFAGISEYKSRWCLQARAMCCVSRACVVRVCVCAVRVFSCT